MSSTDFISLNEIEQNFALFDNWEDRFQYIIDMGKALPDMNAEYKTDEFKVRGCTSQVWLRPTREGDKLFFEADSDAFIVRGLIYIILAAFSGKTPSEISDLDIKDVFTRLGLEQNLSPNRRNGFFAMVEKIKSYAKAAA